MYNYKIVLEYEGTRYNGWQRQDNTPNTIQGVIENVLFNMTGKYIEVIGSGRTDAGTHAKGQVANFKLNTLWDTYELVKELNNRLPSDIGVVDCSLTDLRFHSRLNAVGKVYTYRLALGRANVFDRRTVFSVEDNIDISKIKAAAQLLVGKYDFRGFSSDKRKKKSTERQIYLIDVNLKNNVLEITYCGNGFLYNMVRILTGTLLEIGTGKKNIDIIPAVFESKNRAMAGITMPPRGLMLEKVFYTQEELNEYIARG